MDPGAPGFSLDSSQGRALISTLRTEFKEYVNDELRRGVRAIMSQSRTNAGSDATSEEDYIGGCDAGSK
jgi:hypothetical protein